jgi:hypothetical protein
MLIFFKKMGSNSKKMRLLGHLVVTGCGKIAGERPTAAMRAMYKTIGSI